MTNLARSLLEQPLVGRAVRWMIGRILHRPDISIPQETIGGTYSSHTVRVGALSSDSVVYSFGVGEDVSFDLGLIERYGCHVHTFDPTPRSLAWARANIHHPRLTFHPLGIAARDGTADFTSPPDEARVSFSHSVKDDRLDSYVRLPVRTLASIMRDFSHDRIHLLKLDVEGFEYEVLESLLATEVRPEQIAVEFHHGMYGHKAAETKGAVNALRQAGYGLFHVSPSGREYSFCLLSSLPGEDRFLRSHAARR